MIHVTAARGVRPEKTMFFFSQRQMRGYGVDEFHWTGVANSLGYNTYFIRDTRNRFYSTPEFGLICKMLQRTVRSLKNEVIFAGSSMGAYGAIKFANICRPDKVIAFSPVYRGRAPIECKSPTHIHICRNATWDKVNGFNDRQNAALFVGASLTVHDGDSHNSAGVLKETNKLLELFK